MEFMPLTVLLDTAATIPVHWASIAATIIIGFITFLAKDAYNELKARDIDHTERLEKLNDKLEEERSERIAAEARTDRTINELHITILNKLDEIKYKFNEFRK